MVSKDTPLSCQTFWVNTFRLGILIVRLSTLEFYQSHAIALQSMLSFTLMDLSSIPLTMKNMDQVLMVVTILLVLSLVQIFV